MINDDVFGKTETGSKNEEQGKAPAVVRKSRQIGVDAHNNQMKAIRIKLDEETIKKLRILEIALGLTSSEIFTDTINELFRDKIGGMISE